MVSGNLFDRRSCALEKYCLIWNSQLLGCSVGFPGNLAGGRTGCCCHYIAAVPGCLIVADCLCRTILEWHGSHMVAKVTCLTAGEVCQKAIRTGEQLAFLAQHGSVSPKCSTFPPVRADVVYRDASKTHSLFLLRIQNKFCKWCQ